MYLILPSPICGRERISDTTNLSKVLSVLPIQKFFLHEIQVGRLYKTKKMFDDFILNSKTALLFHCRMKEVETSETPKQLNVRMLHSLQPFGCFHSVPCEKKRELA